MAVSIAAEIRNSGDATEETDQDHLGGRYRRRFLVTTSNSLVGPLAVLNAPGLPPRFSPYTTSTEFDNTVRVIERSPRRIGPNQWHVDVVYSTLHGDEEQAQNPIGKPPEIRFDFVDFRVPIPGEVTPESPGDPTEVVWTKGLATSAGEVFNPPAMMDESRPRLTVVRNEIVLDVPLIIEYQNAVNTDVFFGAQPRQARVNGISATRQQERGVRYWRVKYVFTFKRDTWDIQLLDQGTYYCPGGGTCTREDGEEFTTKGGVPGMGNLDGDGDKLAANLPAKFIRATVYKERAFSVLNIPQTLEA